MFMYGQATESRWVINRNLTVSPCGRSAGTVPESPELDTKNKIIVIND